MFFTPVIFRIIGVFYFKIMYKGIAVASKEEVYGEHIVVNGYDAILTEKDETIIVYSESLEEVSGSEEYDQAFKGCCISFIIIVVTFIIMGFLIKIL